MSSFFHGQHPDLAWIHASAGAAEVVVSLTPYLLSIIIFLSVTTSILILIINYVYS
jgi:hypothetical protein